MDPVTQTLAQQSSGSAEGQGFGQFYVQGKQLNLAQQRLDLEKKQEARMQASQDALLPVQKQLLENQAVMQGAQLGTITTASDVKAAMAIANPMINELHMDIINDPNGYRNDAAYQKWNALLDKYPWAAYTPNGKEIDLGFKSVHMRTQQAIDMMEADKAAQRGFNYMTPEGKAAWDKQSAFDDVQKLAGTPEYQKSFDPAKLVPGWYDPNTGHYDPEKVAISLQAMPRSETLQSREQISFDRMQAQVDLMQFKLDHGGGYTPGAVEKDIQFYEQQFKEGKITKDQLDQARKQRMFLEPKPAVRKVMSQADYVDKHIDHLMSQDPRLKRDQAREILKKEWSKDFGAAAPVSIGGKVLNYDPNTNSLK